MKRLERESITWIVKNLRYRKVAKPALYSRLYALGKGSNEFLGDFIWATSTVDKILKNPMYCGDIVNFKTFHKFKIKKIFKNQAENMEVFKDAHEPIISRENFEEVQKTFKAKPGNPKTIEKNIFSGFLKCSDCGCNLNYKTSFGYSGQKNHFFSCKNHRAKNSLCSKSHHIRADFLNEYVKNI